MDFFERRWVKNVTNILLSLDREEILLLSPFLPLSILIPIYMMGRI